jgi:DNA-dependent RNA polymerase auxiliary subunit epsilon
MNINNIGAGVGFGQGPETIVGQNPMKFNVSAQKYMGHWITNDHKFGGVHVLSRVKSFTIYLDHLMTEQPFGYPLRPNLKKHHYNIRFINPKLQKEIEYEKFDYSIIKTNINVHADSLVNEMWPLFRILWRTRGGYTATIKFSPELDLTEFGDQYLPGGYSGEFKFMITNEGKWAADFKWDFQQTFVRGLHDERPPERLGPFFAQDYSRLKGNTASRARKLAKPHWGEEGRGGEDFNILINEEAHLNQTIDWTFKYWWKGSGDWSNAKDFEVSVSNQKKEATNYKPVVFMKK